MKKGFTMIELVFVIVILGILASLAVPKLAATRDDAEAAKAAVEMKDVITQFTAHYTVKGTFKPTDSTTSQDSTISDDDMKKISATYAEATKRTGNKWTDCVEFILNDKDNNTSIAVKAKESGKSSFCSAVRGTQAYKDWSTYGIQVGGSSIFKEEPKKN
ncbi:putative type II secretion system protein [Campylobacter hyointestinalis subsp. lawsonii CCUG 27631]|uniref:type II secretion system protein n=1 Tax=Campylobacter hyointestinalis TaxID=198 RepID=UPI0007C966AA|nr:type II secretion system protein [Campylobacter hyointestinalis]ANE34911.1 putative type II secretion system protein [Campylobacter hyointestinalis subsp. lawsonii CCUG 27631]